MTVAGIGTFGRRSAAAPLHEPRTGAFTPHELASAGHKPTKVSTRAAVTLDKVPDGFKITRIALTCTATVPGIDEAKFQQIANAAKVGCPVSKALAATQIDLTATLTK